MDSIAGHRGAGILEQKHGSQVIQSRGIGDPVVHRAAVLFMIKLSYRREKPESEKFQGDRSPRHRPSQSPLLFWVTRRSLAASLDHGTMAGPPNVLRIRCP